MNYSIIVKEKPEQADVLAIALPLQQFNTENGPAPNAHHVTLHVIDEEGKALGGLFGKIGYNLLFIEYLVVPPELRGTGIGRDLIFQAEEIARGHQCELSWLQTLEFQARGFYEKMGYTVFAELDEIPNVGSLYFMRKSLKIAA